MRILEILRMMDLKQNLYNIEKAQQDMLLFEIEMWDYKDYRDHKDATS